MIIFRTEAVLMRFGYCTGFAAGMTGPIDYKTLDMIQAAGYDYVEFPLMQLADLPQDEFEALKAYLCGMTIGCDACCNMFPARVRLLGEEAKESVIDEYLTVAFARMAELGTKTIVLGSSGARRLPEGMSKEEGVKLLAEVIAKHVIPRLEEHDITLVMEPIGSYEANFINTLPDGMEVVEAVNHPRVQLLADSVHLLYENEPPEHITRYAENLWHIHLCENERALPVEGISEELKAILDAICESGYDACASFEPMPHSVEEMRAALEQVKRALGIEMA